MSEGENNTPKTVNQQDVISRLEAAFPELQTVLQANSEDDEIMGTYATLTKDLTDFVNFDADQAKEAA